MIKQCLEKTVENVDSIVLDWKGIKSEHKSKIISILDTIDVNWEKV